MKRLLSTVAFSALIVGAASSGWAQSSAPSNAAQPTATQAQPSGNNAGALQTDKSTAPSATPAGKSMSSATPADKSMTTPKAAAATDKAMPSTTASSSSSSQPTPAAKPAKKVVRQQARADDKTADQLNRDELQRVAGMSSAPASQYGSSGAAPSAGSGSAYPPANMAPTSPVPNYGGISGASNPSKTGTAR